MERLIRDADLGISHLAGRREPTSFKNAPGEMRELFEQYTVRTTHTVHDSAEAIEFSLEEDESLGTQRFFGIVGRILKAFDDGDVLAVDELDCSMHPLLTQKLIELFQSDEANPNGAQLLFTTHDSSLMNPSLLRRDQIWFSQKNSEAATDLFSLCDIERRPRKQEAFERNYLAGRYGAVPSFGPALEDYEIR
jgi:AAA15 family ATPase/GTPase